MIKHLLVAKWQMQRNLWNRRSPWTRMLLVAVFVACFLLFVFASRWLFGYVETNQGGNVEELLTNVLNILCSILVIGGIYSVYSALYESSDLALLTVAPVPAKSIFAMKHVEICLSLGQLFLLITFPILLVYGFWTGAELLYYPISFISALLLLSTISSLIQILTLILMRWMPDHLRKEILSALAGVFGFVIYNFIHVIDFQNLDVGYLKGTAVLPSAWVVRIASSFAQGDALQGLLILAVLLIVSLVAFWITIVFMEKAFYSGWFMTGESRSKVAFSAGDGRRWAWLSKWISMDVATMIQKDLKIHIRSMNQWDAFLFPITVFAILSFSMLRKYPDALNFMIISAFVGCATMMTSSIALHSVSREGKNIAILQTCAIPVQRVLRSKFLYAVVPPLLLLVLPSIVVSLWAGFSIVKTLCLAAAIACCTFVSSSLATSFGFYFANFEGKSDGGQKISLLGAILFILTLLLVMAALLLSLGSVLVSIGSVNFSHRVPTWFINQRFVWMWGGAVSFVLILLAAMSLPISWVAKIRPYWGRKNE